MTDSTQMAIIADAERRILICLKRGEFTREELDLIKAAMQQVIDRIDKVIERGTKQKKPGQP